MEGRGKEREGGREGRKEGRKEEGREGRRKGRNEGGYFLKAGVELPLAPSTP